MKYSEDVLCRIFAEKVRDSHDFCRWVLGHTKFHDRTATLLYEEQVWRRPKVKPENWWRHWWRKIPELNQERETDIFLVFEGNMDCSRFALHIENKQDAKFAPGQAEDYEPRARWMMGMPRYLNYSDFQTMLIAPASFRQQDPKNSTIFDCFISYEEISHFVPEFSRVAVAQ